jgi:hypothetical protein
MMWVTNAVEENRVSVFISNLQTSILSLLPRSPHDVR